MIVRIPEPADENTAPADRQHVDRPRRRGNIDSLTGLRAIAALWVVLYHYRFDILVLLPWTRWAEPIMAAGFLGVEVFFVLSGFIIAYNYAEQLRAPSWSGYVKYLYLRLARIYPVHLVTLLLVSALYVGAAVIGINPESRPDGGALGYVSNLVLLQGLPPGQMAWNGPAWTITYEWIAYLAFPLFAMALVHLRSRAKLLMLAATALLIEGIGLSIFAGLGVELTISHAPGLLRIFGAFTAGVAIFGLYRSGAAARGSWDVMTFTIGIVVLSLIFVCADLNISVFTLLPLIVVGIFGLSRVSGFLSKVMASRVAVYAGTISYSLYMTHILALVLLHRALPSESLATVPWWVRVVMVGSYLLFALCAAAAMYHIVERPARTWMKARVSRADAL